MNLGDIVTFDRVVIRKRDGYRVIPTSETIQPLTGILVGISRVYEANTEPNPPVLTNPKTVYVVAVSLTKRYKVFEEDLQPMARKPFDPQDLTDQIDKTLGEKIAARENFTAYDITTAIRAANPGMDVPHAEVRDQVHLFMSGEINVNGLDYEAAEEDFGTYTAIVYRPK